MSAGDSRRFSTQAEGLFAEFVERIERGEAIDFDSEFRAQPALEHELRELLERWKRLDTLLGDLRGHESALDFSERAVRGENRLDPATRAALARLAGDLPPGKRYEKHERIARGGMSEVWRVSDRELERVLAMKIVRGSVGASGAGLARFLAEARLVARLDHPGIVPIHDLGVDADRRLFFTMPLVQGKSLTEILVLARDQREGWTVPRVLEVLLRVCDTLAFAHAQNVVHRDLKPGNVMVGRFGETYVLDWGLARILEASREASSGASSGASSDDRSAVSAALQVDDDAYETRAGAVIGTPHYMPPEQAAGRRAEVGPRADVYAIGAVLYHLLRGRAPYSDERGARTGREVINAVIAGPPEPLRREDADVELAAICEKAMARSPEARYASPRALAEDVRAYLDGRVVNAHKRGAWIELRKWVARNRGWALTIGIALGAVIGGLSAFAAYRARSEAEILRLADVRRLVNLESESAELWPATPAIESRLRAWLHRARALVDRQPEHAQALAAMRQADAESASEEERWRKEALTALVAGLERLRAPDPRVGAMASVEARLAQLQRLAETSLIQAAAVWRATVEDIADTSRTPAYGGLSLEPQLGLVPLGRDPRTGLHEFAHVASGTVPERDARGELVLGPESAVVLVLLPGGTFAMGSIPPGSATSAGIAEDRFANASESPRRTVELAPFFLAKHEMTRAQWKRASGTEPSSSFGLEDELRPVDSVAWREASATVRELGLVLPTEARWEYGARGGRETRWWCGSEPGSLAGAANGRAWIDPRLRASSAELMSLSAFTLRANPFGLHHVLGNVAEWTADFAPETYERAPSGPSGELLASERKLRVARGGSYESFAEDLRCAARWMVPAENHDPRIGVRPARDLDP